MTDHPTSTETHDFDEDRVPVGQIWRRLPPWGRRVVGWSAALAVLIVVAPIAATALIDASHAQPVSTAKFKINQLGQQVLAEIVLAENPVPTRLEDVEGVKPEQLVDPWGRPFHFIVPGPGDTPFDIVSFGRDGKPGGTGRDTDLKYSEL